MFRHVIVLANRTACCSASFISPAKSSAVPSFFASGRRSFAGLSRSETTSSFQVSRVRPAARFFSVGKRMRQRLATRHIEEFLPRREVGFERFHSLGEFR